MKNRFVRKVFAVILSIMLLSTFSLLAACGSAQKAQDAGAAEATKAEAPKADAAKTEAPKADNAQKGEKVTLNAVMLGATWGTATKDLAVEYEKQTGVKVNVELVGRDAIHEKLALAIAGKSDYDIFNVDYPWVPEFASSGNLYPLDELIKKYNVDTSKFMPRALALGQWNNKNGDFGGGGTIYAFPQTIHPHLLWYNSDLFNDAKNKSDFKAKYGYDLAAPKTMKEFRDTAEFFNGKTVNGQKIYGWAAQASKGFGNVHTWLSFVYSNGGDVIKWDDMTSSLSTPEVVEATKTWADLMKFTPPGINDYTFAEVSADADMAKIAMAIHWSWSAFEVDDPSKSKTVGKWDFVQVPTMKSSVPHLAGWALAIPKTSKKAEEAFKFINWLESAENDIRQAEMGGGDPVRADSYNSPKLTDLKIEGTDVKKFRRYTALAEAMKTTKARPFFPQEEKWETAVSIYLSAIQLGKAKVEDALKEADKDVNKLIKK